MTAGRMGAQVRTHWELHVVTLDATGDVRGETVAAEKESVRALGQETGRIWLWAQDGHPDWRHAASTRNQDSNLVQDLAGCFSCPCLARQPLSRLRIEIHPCAPQYRPPIWRCAASWPGSDPVLPAKSRIPSCWADNKGSNKEKGNLGRERRRRGTNQSLLS